jgi:hypothetical protein
MIQSLQTDIAQLERRVADQRPTRSMRLRDMYLEPGTGYGGMVRPGERLLLGGRKILPNGDIVELSPEERASLGFPPPETTGAEDPRPEESEN